MEKQDNPITGYELSRNWFNFCFDNPEKINPTHSAIYFFAIEHCNRLGWKPKFGFPSQMAMEAIGVKNWRTYSKALRDLVDFGFIVMIQTSKNQYSSNIIALVNFTKAHTKALDKAMQKHGTKQRQSTVSIDKQRTKEQRTEKPYNSFAHLSISDTEFNKLLKEYSKQQIDDTIEAIQNYRQNSKYKSLYLTTKKWLKKEYKKLEVTSNNSHLFKP